MLLAKRLPIVRRRTTLYSEDWLNGLGFAPVQQMCIVENLSQPQAKLSNLIVFGKALHLSHKSLITLLPCDIELRIRTWTFCAPRF